MKKKKTERHFHDAFVPSLDHLGEGSGGRVSERSSKWTRANQHVGGFHNEHVGVFPSFPLCFG